MLKKIIGIDPGLIHTGWGLIAIEGNLIKHIDHGLIKVKTGQDLPDRLHDIHRDLSSVLGNFLPDEAAIEQTFVNNNALSSLKLGHARGAIMLSLSMMNIKCFEYAPNQIKKSIVGKGHADKNQIAHMVNILLSKKNNGTSDVSDALAIAITHANHRHNKIAKAIA